MKKILMLITISLCYFSSPAFSDSTDKLLLDIASEMNKSLPMRIDEVTTWDSSMCLESQNQYMYFYTILSEDSYSDYNSSALKVFYNKVINKFCTGPDTSYLLEFTDIGMIYYNINGEFLFKNEFSKEDC